LKAPGEPEVDSTGGVALGRLTFDSGDGSLDLPASGFDGRDLELVLERRTTPMVEAHWPRQPDHHPIAMTPDAAMRHVSSLTLKAQPDPDRRMNGSARLLPALQAATPWALRLVRSASGRSPPPGGPDRSGTFDLVGGSVNLTRLHRTPRRIFGFNLPRFRRNHLWPGTCSSWSCPPIQAANSLDYEMELLPMRTLTTPFLFPLRIEPRHLAPTRPSPRHRSISLLGGGLGLLAFLVVGLVPALVIGGASGARIAGLVLGDRVAPGAGASGFMIAGLVLTSVLGAAFFTTLGAVAGSVVGALTRDQDPRQGTPR
jgi:hypothetical protein